MLEGFQFYFMVESFDQGFFGLEIYIEGTRTDSGPLRDIAHFGPGDAVFHDGSLEVGAALEHHRHDLRIGDVERQRSSERGL